jgi:hypothetical protein
MMFGLSAADAAGFIVSQVTSAQVAVSRMKMFCFITDIGGVKFDHVERKIARASHPCRNPKFAGAAKPKWAAQATRRTWLRRVFYFLLKLNCTRTTKNIMIAAIHWVPRLKGEESAG